MAKRSGQYWVGVLQPVYLPWLGYFEQIDRVDHFIFQDDVQYTARDWRNRNRIKTAQGPQWLTVPVKKAPLATPIADIEIAWQTDWPKKHLKAIELAYAKAPYRSAAEALLDAAFAARPDRLADLTIDLIERLAGVMGIEPRTSRASEQPPASAPADLDDRLVDLARRHGASHVYFGASASAYVDPARFRPHGIEVVFQDYAHPVYAQQWPGFESHMSVIDLVMNEGPEAARAIIRSGAKS